MFNWAHLKFTSPHDNISEITTMVIIFNVLKSTWESFLHTSFVCMWNEKKNKTDHSVIYGLWVETNKQTNRKSKKKQTSTENKCSQFSNSKKSDDDDDSVENKIMNSNLWIRYIVGM